MNKPLSLLAAGILSATGVQATTAEYGWEDSATILGSFSASHIEHSHSDEQARTGNFSLKVADIDATDNSTPQSYIGWVNGLTDGDTVDVNVWVYDDSDDRPAGRVWGHYTDDAEDATSYAGSAGGNSDYTTGAGWQQLQHSWTFDSNGGSRDGLMVEFRLYDSADFTTGALFVDDIAITVSAGAVTLANGDVVVAESESPGEEEPAAELVCGADFTAINAIQGNGDNTPLDGQVVEVEAIVTADFQNSLSGLYLQSAAADQDEDNTTSEGIFVFTGSEPLTAAPGDRIRLSATAGEFRDVTQLSSVTAMSICEEQAGGVVATELTLPFETLPEHLEGMLVSFTDLTVNEVFQLGRFGTVTLSNGRRYIPTQVAAPGDDANALAAANALNEIVLDDGSNQQNPEIAPYPTGGLSAQNSLRIGDSMSLSQGVMHYAFGDYRIHPTTDVTVTNTNLRTAAPELANEGNVKVASFNLLNYFTTLDERGADTEQELQRQQAKLITALVGLDADVVGLMELENNGFDDTSAIASLVTALNEADPGADWHYITPEVSQIGTDAITVGLIYKANIVTPINAAAILDSSNSSADEDGNTLFLDNLNRPSLAQEFSLVDNSETFVVAVNHFKSKGSDCDDLNDPDTGDGQGNCNITRARAAQAVANWLNNDFVGKPVLVIGDLNAYAMEDPLTTLATEGFSELFAHLEKEGAYSYVFGGESGQLDHALANAALLDSVTDAAEWHINTDEPVSLDYNVEFKSDAQIDSYYAADPYRSSDHDPLIVALNLVPADLGNQPVIEGDDVDEDSSGGSLSGILVILLGMFAGRRLISRKD